MDQSQKQKLIAQILVGSAWIDRHLEPEERTYLQTFLDRHGFGHDQDLTAMLIEPIPVQDTERRLVQYLKAATNDERMQLLAHIGKVLIADDTVSEIEHDLLDEYHELMARIPAQPDPQPSVSDAVESVPEEIGKAARHIGSFVVDLINRFKNESTSN